MPWDLSVDAKLLLIRLTDDYVADRPTPIKQTKQEVKAFLELSRLGLADTAGGEWPREEFFVGRPTDAGLRLVAAGFGRSEGQAGPERRG